MNKKVLSIVLGIVVLFVWYKVISSLFGTNIEDQSFRPRKAYENINLSTLIGNDSIPTPQLNYRDPFLGKVDFKKVSNNQPSKPTVSNPNIAIGRPVRKEDNLKWPEISYHGFVKVHGNKSSMVILKINNRLVQINEGEAYESTLQIRKAYRDSILLEMNGNRKVFYK